MIARLCTVDIYIYLSSNIFKNNVVVDSFCGPKLGGQYTSLLETTSVSVLTSIAFSTPTFGVPHTQQVIDDRYST